MRFFASVAVGLYASAAAAAAAVVGAPGGDRGRREAGGLLGPGGEEEGGKKEEEHRHEAGPQLARRAAAIVHKDLEGATDDDRIDRRFCLPLPEFYSIDMKGREDLMDHGEVGNVGPVEVEEPVAGGTANVFDMRLGNPDANDCRKLQSYVEHLAYKNPQVFTIPGASVQASQWQNYYPLISYRSCTFSVSRLDIRYMPPTDGWPVFLEETWMSSMDIQKMMRRFIYIPGASSQGHITVGDFGRPLTYGVNTKSMVGFHSCVTVRDQFNSRGDFVHEAQTNGGVIVSYLTKQAGGKDIARVFEDAGLDLFDARNELDEILEFNRKNFGDPYKIMSRKEVEAQREAATQATQAAERERRKQEAAAKVQEQAERARLDAEFRARERETQQEEERRYAEYLRRKEKERKKAAKVQQDRKKQKQWEAQQRKLQEDEDRRYRAELDAKFEADMQWWKQEKSRLRAERKARREREAQRSSRPASYWRTEEEPAFSFKKANTGFYANPSFADSVLNWARSKKEAANIFANSRYGAYGQAGASYGQAGAPYGRGSYAGGAYGNGYTGGKGYTRGNGYTGHAYRPGERIDLKSGYRRPAGI